MELILKPASAEVLLWFRLEARSEGDNALEDPASAESTNFALRYFVGL
jgi:hypothetical protein